MSSTTTDLLNSIRATENGLTLAELLTGHPDIARRTAQRLIAKLIESGQVAARGEGRARRYFGAVAQIDTDTLVASADSSPPYIPLSADSQDILTYIDQPPEARKPVGYQRDFLDVYRPNETWYLSESLRRQLHKMGIEPLGRQHIFPSRYTRTHRARQGRTWEGRHRNPDDSES